MAAPSDRLQALERIEGDIASVLHLAAAVLQELSKDKPSVKQVENHANQFLKTLNTVETELSRQIAYLTQVSTGQPHEGSCYAAGKLLQMAWHRLQHARNEVQQADGRRGQLASSLSRQQLQPPPPYSQQSTPTAGGGQGAALQAGNSGATVAGVQQQVDAMAGQQPGSGFSQQKMQ